MALGSLSVPAPDAQRVQIRFSPLPRAGEWRQNLWRHEDLASSHDGWWRINLDTLGLPDGAWEYEFIAHWNNNTARIAADPYAEEVTRFSGTRGVFHTRNGQRIRIPFSWEDELPAGARLPNNNEMVIYELPMRWVDAGEDGYARQVGLGTFDKATFERLNQTISALKVNCIELLPIQDSQDTLNWGYGTRFFFAPDHDMGEPFDLKLFIKRCHQRGIRVIMDVVMNHARGCPLRDFAFDWFFLHDENEEKDNDKDEPRPAWGGDIFRYKEPRGGSHKAREFQFGVAEFFIREYHVDGFRLDEFKGIKNYEFIQDFTDHAHAVHGSAFPDRPFIVIAEDSWRRSAITDKGYRDRRVVDSMWDFEFRDTARRLVSNTLYTKWGDTSRSRRMRQMLTVGQDHLFSGDEAGKRLFRDMARRVSYCTSHDIEGDEEQRLIPYYLEKLSQYTAASGSQSPLLAELATDQAASTFALMLTAAGIPMFLAGEEFGELHDIDRRNWRHKMSDPIDWLREKIPGHRELLARVRELIELRVTHSALHRNELEFFGFAGGFHPRFDDNGGERLFAYCRTGGRSLGSDGQVIVVGNLRDQDFPALDVHWPWQFRTSLRERGGTGQNMPWITGSSASLALRPFQTRVFSV
jgi:1,4-alpha-glucan branching enzyme